MGWFCLAVGLDARNLSVFGHVDEINCMLACTQRVG